MENELNMEGIIIMTCSIALVIGLLLYCIIKLVKSSKGKDSIG